MAPFDVTYSEEYLSYPYAGRADIKQGHTIVALAMTSSSPSAPQWEEDSRYYAPELGPWSKPSLVERLLDRLDSDAVVTSAVTILAYVSLLRFL